ncbi:LacI family DNA-binding transcriptional regulator [Rhodophyticola porphyridii]|uniref:LacI family DNA-binding transcriptional regulator n=1 Tax=Rhodophyticola porphyridii TaxID=1852017 RepID=A0A3L9Y3S9_9RHOB|nr:LacI family DNA-binding transcriptional regulator [Rhodophyticola porphyridii]RMA43072.1 LacI family DNA-binding transcriptional regulator [Rhodophyticola porphyridii]
MTDGPKRKPTSFDVARLAGVSRSAVSRAYTPGAHIADATRQKVHAAATELGYRVNSLARGLQGQHSGIVGLVASRLDTPLRSRQVRLLGQSLIREGFRPMLLTAEKPDEVGGLIDGLLGYSVAGMIVTSDTPPSALIEDCGRLGLPVVLINRAGKTSWGDRIVADSETSGKLVFDMLRSSGATNLACLAPRVETFSVAGRIRAFMARAEAAGVPCRMLLADDQAYGSARIALKAQSAALEGVDGLFCATDLIAMGALDALRFDLGRAVPDEIQLVGFDDIEQAGWAAYDLSTVHQDLEEQAALAMRLLKERAADIDMAPRTVTQTLVPVYRGTTRHDR